MSENRKSQAVQPTGRSEASVKHYKHSPYQIVLKKFKFGVIQRIRTFLYVLHKYF